MISRESLEQDRQDLIAQIHRLNGALQYINQKIAALDKEKSTPEPAEGTDTKKGG